LIDEIANSYSLVVNDLRQLIGDIPEEQMTEQFGGAANHATWTIGHLIHSAQAIGIEMGLSPWLPAWWEIKFGTGSIPCAAKEEYPSKSELLASLQDAQARILDRLRALGEDGLKQPLPDIRHRDTLPTLGHAVAHILCAHTAMHVGQLTVWRRCLRLDSGSPGKY
jgi:hypothetical protein